MFKKHLTAERQSLAQNWRLIPDYSRSSHSGHGPHDLRWCISSRSACQTDCWVPGWDGTQPASCGPVQTRNTELSEIYSSTLLRWRRVYLKIPKSEETSAVKYLVPLSAHKKDTQHIEHLHLIHDLMDDLHGLGQSVSQRAGGQGALIGWLWRRDLKSTSTSIGVRRRKQCENSAAQLNLVLPVLLWSASSVAICMRASSTRALSSHVYHSSSSCRKFAPVASDTFLVASLHNRSMKPGMFSRVTVGETAKQLLIYQNLLMYSSMTQFLTARRNYSAVRRNPTLVDLRPRRASVAFLLRVLGQ